MTVCDVDYNCLASKMELKNTNTTSGSNNASICQILLGSHILLRRQGELYPQCPSSGGIPLNTMPGSSLVYIWTYLDKLSTLAPRQRLYIQLLLKSRIRYNLADPCTFYTQAQISAALGCETNEALKFQIIFCILCSPITSGQRLLTLISMLLQWVSSDHFRSNHTRPFCMQINKLF